MRVDTNNVLVADAPKAHTPARDTYVLIRHHLLGRDGRVDAPDGALVDVQVVLQALEPPQQEHDRYRQYPRADHDNGHRHDPGRIIRLLDHTLKPPIVPPP